MTTIDYATADDEDNFSGLSKLKTQLQEKLEDIKQIIEVNTIVTDLATTHLNRVKDNLRKSGKGGGISQQIENQIQQMDNLKDSPLMAEGRDKMRAQVLVLFVGALETYLSDLIRYVGNHKPSLFNFSDVNEKISFDQQLLRDGFTLGDAVLEHITHKGANFQDLQSIVRTLANYLGVEIKLVQDDKDTVVLSTGIRHLIIHNSSLVNRKFRSHIGSINSKEDYKDGATVYVTLDLIEKLEKTVLNLAEQINVALIPKFES